jgi:hypothetical protein
VLKIYPRSTAGRCSGYMLSRYREFRRLLTEAYPVVYCQGTIFSPYLCLPHWIGRPRATNEIPYTAYADIHRSTPTLKLSSKLFQSSKFSWYAMLTAGFGINGALGVVRGCNTSELHYFVEKRFDGDHYESNMRDGWHFGCPIRGGPVKCIVVRFRVQW